MIDAARWVLVPRSSIVLAATLLLLGNADGSPWDWNVPAPRAIEVPLKPWHEAGDGKNLVGLSYSVRDTGTLTFNYTVEGALPSLGAGTTDIDEDHAKTLGVAAGSGLLVHQVRADSTASIAGIRVGDILLSLNGKTLGNREDLKLQLVTLGAGSDIDICYRRGEIVTNVTAKLFALVRRIVEYRTSTLKITADELHTGLMVGDLVGKAAVDLLGEGGQGIMVSALGARGVDGFLFFDNTVEKDLGERECRRSSTWRPRSARSAGRPGACSRAAACVEQDSHRSPRPPGWAARASITTTPTRRHPGCAISPVRRRRRHPRRTRQSKQRPVARGAQGCARRATWGPVRLRDVFVGPRRPGGGRDAGHL